MKGNPMSVSSNSTNISSTPAAAAAVVQNDTTSNPSGTDAAKTTGTVIKFPKSAAAVLGELKRTLGLTMPTRPATISCMYYLANASDFIYSFKSQQRPHQNCGKNWLHM
jgi:hypothetical protein